MKRSFSSKWTTVTLVVVLLTAFGALASCGGQTPAAPGPAATTMPAPAATSAPAATTASAAPKTEGILKVAYESEPLMMDPQRAGSNMDRMIGAIPNEFLWVSNKERSGMQPMLATTWNWKDDLTLVVNLRQGVKFSNGRDFTSEDVKYNVQRLQDPKDWSHLWRELQEPDASRDPGQEHGDFPL